MTNLKASQIYKWGWEMKIKEKSGVANEILHTPQTDEFGGYSKNWDTDEAMFLDDYSTKIDVDALLEKWSKNCKQRPSPVKKEIKKEVIKKEVIKKEAAKPPPNSCKGKRESKRIAKEQPRSAPVKIAGRTTPKFGERLEPFNFTIPS